MNQRIICKTLAVAVIILFIGLAIQPSIAVQTETEIDIEPKDYLFQTIIDIANNPEVKNLLEKYGNDLFKVDIDRNVYRKLFLRNPRLMFNTLFTKPSMTIEYLDRCYNKGIEITNIIGEDKVIEIIKNAEVTDTKLFNEINDIITNDEELSSRIETLKEMNTESNSILGYPYPIICSILGLLAIPFFIFYDLINIFGDFYFISLFLAFNIAIRIPYWTVLVISAYAFDCAW